MDLRPSSKPGYTKISVNKTEADLFADNGFSDFQLFGYKLALIADFNEIYRHKPITSVNIRTNLLTNAASRCLEAAQAMEEHPTFHATKAVELRDIGRQVLSFIHEPKPPVL